MKYFIPVVVAICCPILAFSQDITGLWKGTMLNDATKQSLDYEIVITKEKGKYAGYSHTLFLIDGKQYYGIKKINVRVAKDGKVVLQDSKLLENNYPVLPYKNVIQLNVLDLKNQGDESTLDGLFVTNRSKDFTELTGHINITKVNPLLCYSFLLDYLQKNRIESSFTAANK